MHVRTALARRIVRTKRWTRTHRTTGRTIGAATLAGALLLGGVGASIAAADPNDPSTDTAAAASLAAEAPVDPSADPTQPGDPTDLAEIGDDEDAPAELAAEPEPSADQIAAEIAQADAALEARAAKAEEKVRVKKLRSKIVEVAKDQLGDRYVAGRMGPDAFDCSGLTRYVYKQATGKELPHQSRSQYSKVERISVDEAQPGDLVFFFRNGAHHVGIYIGNHKMIDAPGRGGHVRVSPISGSWWGRTFSGMGRIIDPV